MATLTPKHIHLVKRGRERTTAQACDAKSLPGSAESLDYARSSMEKLHKLLNLRNQIDATIATIQRDPLLRGYELDTDTLLAYLARR